MSKDGPKSGGMRFGYREHAKAGVPWVGSTKVGEVNLQNFLKRHSHRTDLIAHARTRLNKGDSASAILHAFREAGHDGKWAIGYWKNEEFSGYASKTEYAHEDLDLLRRAEDELLIGIYKAWLLWERDSVSGAWKERRWFPHSIE